MQSGPRWPQGAGPEATGSGETATVRGCRQADDVQSTEHADRLSITPRTYEHPLGTNRRRGLPAWPGRTPRSVSGDAMARRISEMGSGQGHTSDCIAAILGYGHGALVSRASPSDVLSGGTGTATRLSKAGAATRHGNRPSILACECSECHLRPGRYSQDQSGGNAIEATSYSATWYGRYTR